MIALSRAGERMDVYKRQRQTRHGARCALALVLIDDTSLNPQTESRKMFKVRHLVQLLGTDEKTDNRQPKACITPTAETTIKRGRG